jgi:transcriptional regulator with XRE-family HTH domain
VPRRSRQVTSTEKTIGAKISEIRKRQALTQVELARKLGMSQSLLSRYERGDLRLHGALVADIAKALHVPADELLGLKDSKDNGFFADRRFVRRLQQIDKLSKRKKEALLTTIDGFLRGGRPS